MKKTLLSLTFIFLLNHAFAQLFGSKEPTISIEKVAEKCKDLPRAKRVTIKVARFSITASSAQANANFGDELATMLTSAIQQTNCFRVLEMNKNAADVTSEQAFGQDGFSNGTSPEAGQMLGAQLIVTGEITEFSEGKSGGTAMGISVGGNQATVGFTLKLLHPQTGELLFSKDINMKGSSSGFTGMKVFGATIAGSTQNKAVADALQKAIIRSVEILADEKDKLEIPEPMKPKVIIKYSAQNCSILKNGSPKVMILVTEATTAGTARNNSDNVDIARREREMQLKERENNMSMSRDVVSSIFGRKNEAGKVETSASRQTAASAVYKPVIIEQAATETELTKHFVEAGFRVIDPKVYGKMRQVKDSTGGDLGTMAALGLQMGADIIVTGQTIVERTNNSAGMVSSRARLEIKVIATEDGSILATNAIAGGGIDVSEAVSNKIAIGNASSNMSQYLFERLCSMNMQFANSTPATKSSKTVAAAVPTGNTTEVNIANVNFSQMQTIVTFLKTNTKIKEVKKTLSGNKGKLEITHTMNADQVAEMLSNCKTVGLEITGLDEEKIEASVK